MATSKVIASRWDQIRKRNLEDTEFRDRYERTRRSIAKAQDVLRLIDAQRREAGVSKAALARRVGTNPAALRRLFTSGSGNPTLKTVLEVMDALGIELHVSPKASAGQDGGSRATRRQSTDGQPRRRAVAG